MATRVHSIPSYYKRISRDPQTITIGNLTVMIKSRKITPLSLKEALKFVYALWSELGMAKRMLILHVLIGQNHHVIRCGSRYPSFVCPDSESGFRYPYPDPHLGYPNPEKSV